MASICCCCFSCANPSISTKSLHLSLPSKPGASSGGLLASRSFSKVPAHIVRASSTVDSYESSSDFNFIKRMEQAWLISQQPRPIACSSCQSNGSIECKWCGGTGFFIIGNNMLCEVPSRNTSCIICAGKGSACCPNCKGTGFRAKWLEKPPPPS